MDNKFNLLELEKQTIEKCLQDNYSNKFTLVDCAKLLGISERTLYRKINEFDLKVPTNRNIKAEKILIDKELEERIKLIKFKFEEINSQDLEIPNGLVNELIDYFNKFYSSTEEFLLLDKGGNHDKVVLKKFYYGIILEDLFNISVHIKRIKSKNILKIKTINRNTTISRRKIKQEIGKVFHSTLKQS